MDSILAGSSRVSWLGMYCRINDLNELAILEFSFLQRSILKIYALFAATWTVMK